MILVQIWSNLGLQTLYYDDLAYEPIRARHSAEERPSVSDKFEATKHFAINNLPHSVTVLPTTSINLSQIFRAWLAVATGIRDV
jgi:hypothetical protein